MFYSRPQILKCLIIKGWKYLLGGLINHTPLLIPVFSSQFNIYHQFVQFCCLRQNALQHQVKHYVWLYLCYIYAVNLDSKISVIKTVFFNKIKISLLVLPLLSYLFNQVWVVPFFFFLMPAPVWHSHCYHGCLPLIFIKYCCNISSLFLAFSICYHTKSWHFLSQILLIKGKNNSGSW